MQAVVIGQKWKATNQKPQHGACNQIDGLDRTSVKGTRTCPCHRERGEKQGIGEIDADQIGDLPVHTKQRNRGKPQQMREVREAPDSAPRRRAATGRGWPQCRSSPETACGDRGSLLGLVSLSGSVSWASPRKEQFPRATSCYAPVWFSKIFPMSAQSSNFLAIQPARAVL